MKKTLPISFLGVFLMLFAFADQAEAYYNPGSGRFINRDPIGERGGENLHAFVRNDGVNQWDILGAIQWKPQQLQPGTIAVHDTTTPPPGKDGLNYRVKTDLGNDVDTYWGAVLVPKPDGGLKVFADKTYFCHGLTFGGKGQGPGGHYLSPKGNSVPTILADEWTQIKCCDSKKGDISVYWLDAKKEVNHSATFETVVHKPAGEAGLIKLDFIKTMLRSKHGVLGPERSDSFSFNIATYAKKTYRCYTRKKHSGGIVPKESPKSCCVPD